MKRYRIRYIETVVVEATFLCDKDALAEGDAWEELQEADSASYESFDVIDRIIDSIEELAQ